ncbi:hypothetical protein D3C71_2007770 [compost metagenome]
MVADEGAPLRGDVLLVLGCDNVAGGVVDAVLIKKQSHDLMPAGQRCLGKQQGAARGGRVGGGKQRDGELHGEL